MLKSTSNQDLLDILEDELDEAETNSDYERIIRQISNVCKVILEEWGDVEVF